MSGRPSAEAGAAAGARRSDDAPPRLFVYGSLRLGERNAMATLLRRHARHLGAGTVCGRMYLDDAYPGMILSHAADECVTGDVFELAPGSAERVLARLDAYEGEAYERRTVEVRMADETRVSAFAYLYASTVAGLPRIESGDWLRRA